MNDVSRLISLSLELISELEDFDFSTSASYFRGKLKNILKEEGINFNVIDDTSVYDNAMVIKKQ